MWSNCCWQWLINTVTFRHTWLWWQKHMTSWWNAIDLSAYWGFCISVAIWINHIRLARTMTDWKIDLPLTYSVTLTLNFTIHLNTLLQTKALHCLKGESVSSNTFLRNRNALV
jgi:hypothetical protein